MNSEKQISLLIVDDSPVACQLLTYIAQTDPCIKVLKCVSNGLEAIQFLEAQRPDVIIMDINMPKMNGFDVTRHIMGKSPVPIIICSSEFQGSNVSMSFKAIEAGALAILEKPKGVGDPNFAATVKEYIETIITVSAVKLVTRLASNSSIRSDVELDKPLGIDLQQLKKAEVIGIGASLGGPQTIQKLLAKLKSPYPLPIFIVQHITPGFTEGFVTWLANESPIPVKLASDREIGKPNTIYIAPSHKQLEVHPEKLITLCESLPTETFKPSVSRLFHSLGKNFGSRALGIILTGMGSDGVNELLYLKTQGGLTIAQSEENCVMFGMPREAINIGAATHILNIDQIAKFLNQIA